MKELFQHPPLLDQHLIVEPGQEDLDRISLCDECNGHQYVSLVHSRLHLYAELDILMLRRQAPGDLVHFGDIDNRLKTLLDGLTRPQSRQDVPKDWKPDTSEVPLYCLFSDDRLVTKVAVETDRLLTDGGNAPEDVVVTIRVQLRPSRLIYANMPLV